MPALDELLDADVHAARKAQSSLAHEEQRSRANPFAGIKGFAAQMCSVRWDGEEFFLGSNWPTGRIVEVL